MARRLWGCYSVADHLEPRPFVADLLLYDRLVVPTPAPDDLARWEEHWNPGLQERLLDILGPFAERVEWNAPLREQWEKEWSASSAATEVDSAYQWTRVVISKQLEDEVVETGDVRAVAVYAKPDSFDREWELVGAPRFLRRKTRLRRGKLTQVVGPTSPAQEELARLVVTSLVVPDDGRDDEEVLERTVALVSRNDVAARRAEFHELIASLSADGIRDTTVVSEIEELLDAYNDSVRRNTKQQVARACVTAVTWTVGGFALWLPPVGLAAGPTASIGEALIKRRWGAESNAGMGAVSLLAEAQHSLAE